MIFIRYKVWTHYCGTDVEDVETFPDGTSEAEIDSTIEDICHDNAESFSYIFESNLIDPDNPEEYEAAEEEYYEDCGYDWDYITEEEYNEFE